MPLLKHRAYNLSLLLLLFCLPLSGQVVFRDTTQHVNNSNTQKTQFSIGFGFGYASPQELNSHIREELAGSYISGSTDLNLYVELDAALWFPINERLSAGPLLEGAVASKTLHDVSANMQASVYSLWRFSPGLALQYTIPLQNTYWYFSPAIQYHMLKYNALVGMDLQAKSPGFRLEAGYATMLWSMDIRYRLIGTFMNPGKQRSSQPNLNFSGLAFGVGISLP